jgi:hypothetical protein
MCHMGLKTYGDRRVRSFCLLLVRCWLAGQQEGESIGKESRIRYSRRHIELSNELGLHSVLGLILFHQSEQT